MPTARTERSGTAREPARADAVNGPAMGAVLAAGIGSSAMGLFVILNEAGVYSAPELYGPAGGLSGRSTFAVATWLIAWAVVHARWRHRDVAPRPVLAWTLALTGLGILASFPPLWSVF